jgi:hypothetical protein
MLKPLELPGYSPCTGAMQINFRYKVIIHVKKTGELMAFRLTLELLVTHDVLLAVKEYSINIPDLCINAILSEIQRNDEINKAISTTTISKDIEITELRNALRIMREKLEKAEIAAAAHTPWHVKLVKHK